MTTGDDKNRAIISVPFCTSARPMQRDVCTATKARSKETRVKVTGEREKERGRAGRRVRGGIKQGESQACI